MSAVRRRPTRRTATRRKARAILPPTANRGQSREKRVFSYIRATKTNDNEDFGDKFAFRSGRGGRRDHLVARRPQRGAVPRRDGRGQDHAHKPHSVAHGSLRRGYQPHFRPRQSIRRPRRPPYLSLRLLPHRPYRGGLRSGLRGIFLFGRPVPGGVAREDRGPRTRRRHDRTDRGGRRRSPLPPTRSSSAVRPSSWPRCCDPFSYRRRRE